MRASNVIQLRQLLSERFPHLRTTPPPRREIETVPTGAPALDALLHGGLPRGALSELIGAGPGSGSAQVLHGFLQRVADDGKFLALVDGADSFDVDAVEPAILARLLWVRCTDAGQALKAADLLLRDRNFPLVVVDLKFNPPAQLRKISSSVWHRFRRLLEANGAAALVITPHQLVSNPACRVRVEGKLAITALAQSPSQVLSELHFDLLRAAEVDEEATAAAAS
jgi:hypothetical protein